MHLRGPMNVSQLAVYQLPSDMHTLRKRNTVPFYNGRRALGRRDAYFTALEQSLPTTTSSSNNRKITTPEKNMGRRAGADWSRVAYYTSAAPAQATGLSFLANLGDPRESGTFD
jgi:hypothetical protein